jgi:hypothetical protein
MIRIIILLLLCAGYARAQQILINDTTKRGNNIVETTKFLGTENNNTHTRMPVDAYIKGPITGGATSAKQDSLLNVNKNMRSWLAALMTYTDGLEKKIDSLKFNQTNGLQKALTTPQNPFSTIKDSLAHSGSAHIDSVIFSPLNLYGYAIIFMEARTDKADTLNFYMRSVAGDLVWGTKAFGLVDMQTKIPLTSNSSVIISQNENRRFLITVPRPYQILITRTTTNSVNRILVIKTALEEGNL